MHRITPTFIIATIILSLGFATAASADGVSAQTNLPSCPQQIPADWLSPSGYPRLLCTADELVKARATVRHTDWGKAYLDEQRAICASFIGMDETKLRSFIPKPGSLFVYGLGMNLDPIHQKRMVWCGWDKPFSVKDVDGKVYPNDEWHDDGSGVVDPKTGERYYFVAQANAKIIQKLEQDILPALADVYALDGNKDAARVAAILLDEIAVVYPTNHRGPIDYPLDYPDDPADADHAGRLDRPYYQVARGMMNYANTVDLIASSGEFEKPSIAPGQSMREHIVRNLLWDGALYSMYYATHNFLLHNGQADYLRGAAAPGILLGQPDLCAPLFYGRAGMPAMLDNNIDRSGLYYETSPMYADHTRGLFISMADIFDAARNLHWKDVESVYAHPAMRLFLTETFDKQEVGGHVPVLGDDGPDVFVNDPIRRFPAGKFVLSDNYLNGQILGAWVRLVRGSDPSDRQSAARLLADTFNGKSRVVPPHDRWSIYHIGLDAIKQVESQKPDTTHFETNSVFYGGKGLAILRGGRGSQRYGAQLFFGPLHLHGQEEALTWSFFARGAEWSYDPGYFNSHYRFGWTGQSVAHQSVTVNTSSIDPDHGGGHLISWLSTPDIQWAMADHPGAYRDRGVTKYERLIAQVNNPSTGDLGYWLDVSRVAGGKTRDDSFHTQMKDVKLNIELPKPSAGSVFGPIDYGRIIQDDFHLRGYSDKGFYWSPDGDGYGFLGNPREIAMTSNVRATMSNPGYASSLNASIITDMPSAPGRQLIVADGPQAMGAIPAPYILRRDTGDGLSVFAKIVRLVDKPESDYISSFMEIPVENAPETKAWCVTWTDKRRDIWIVGDGRNTVHITQPNLPEITSDARVALLRFDAANQLLDIQATEATAIKVANGPELRSARAAVGKIERVNPKDSPIVLKVSWKHFVPTSIQPGTPLITIPSSGQPSVWDISSISGDGIKLTDIKSVLGSTVFQPISGKPGWYEMLTAISRFTSPSGNSNHAYAIGKSVYMGDKYLGKISDIATDGHSVKIESNTQPITLDETFAGKILEVGQGDELRIPLTLTWTRK